MVDAQERVFEGSTGAAADRGDGLMSRRWRARWPTAVWRWGPGRCRCACSASGRQLREQALPVLFALADGPALHPAGGHTVAGADYLRVNTGWFRRAGGGVDAENAGQSNDCSSDGAGAHGSARWGRR